MDESKEAGSEFIEAGGNPPELLKLEEEGFHKMAFLVEPPIDEPRVGVVRLGRDAEIRVVVGDKLTKLPLAVGPVSENSGAFQVNPAEQFFGDSDVAGVAGRQHDLNRIAQSVHNGVNLGTSAAPTDADALIDLGFRPDSILLLAGGFYGISGF